jgi:hypothetical protein
MKLRVLYKTTSFHLLLKKTKGKAQNGVVLNGTVEEEDFIPLFFSPPSFYESLKKTLTKTPHLALTRGLSRGEKIKGTCPSGGREADA